MSIIGCIKPSSNGLLYFTNQSIPPPKPRNFLHLDSSNYGLVPHLPPSPYPRRHRCCPSSWSRSAISQCISSLALKLFSFTLGSNLTRRDFLVEMDLYGATDCSTSQGGISRDTSTSIGCTRLDTSFPEGMGSLRWDVDPRCQVLFFPGWFIISLIWLAMTYRYGNPTDNACSTAGYTFVAAVGQCVNTAAQTQLAFRSYVVNC
jgi:hypothetical protein